MKIFISWSGDKSKYVAETFSNWLEQVLQAAEPWISSEIQKGKRWSQEIADKLKDSKIGIICLTSDNLDSNWIHFETGAIAKTEDAYVCTFLFDISSTDVKQPLSQFQNTINNKEDILKLLKTINSKIGQNGGKALKEQNLESVFSTFYPELERKFAEIPLTETDELIKVHRSDRDLLEEALGLLRMMKGGDLESVSISNSDKDEIIDFWIDFFASRNNIPKYSNNIRPHEDAFLKFMKSIPEIKMIFKTSDNLKRIVKERIDELLPF